MAQLGGDELKQILDEKRRSRWQIGFGALLTGTAAENAAVPRKKMSTLIKLKAYQTKLIRHRPDLDCQGKFEIACKKARSSKCF